MKKELTNHCAVVCKMLFKCTDIPVALIPDLWSYELFGKPLGIQNFWMYLHYQCFFVIGAIEDSNSAAFGKLVLAAPKIVVVEILGRWRFERSDLASLR